MGHPLIYFNMYQVIVGFNFTNTEHYKSFSIAKPHIHDIYIYTYIIISQAVQCNYAVGESIGE